MSDAITPTPAPQRSRVWYLVTALVTAIVTYCIVALLMNISERKQEAKQRYLKLVELTEETIDAFVVRVTAPVYSLTVTFDSRDPDNNNTLSCDHVTLTAYENDAYFKAINNAELVTAG